MALNSTEQVPVLRALPITLPRDGAVELQLEQGVLVFRASEAVQEHIETLLRKQRAAQLTATEAQELEQYEEIDDYLSFLNRLTRNLARSRPPGGDSAA
ncbi:MAG: hypothetical protein M3R15_32740 [Acidobacteriota bacterium]|nr:hypothetical protein [Acidobacteriota bacterium]